MCGKVYVVGIGPGSEDYILPKAIDTLKNSEVILGFKRAIESLKFINTDKIVVNKISETLDFINSNTNKNISIAASGDPLFYGITEYLKKNFSGNIEIVPGLSSFQYMMAKICISWQGSFLGSLHGREENFYKIVEENPLSIWLTDRKHSPAYMCSILEEKNIEAKIYVGENLSYDDEKITMGNVSEIKSMNFTDLCVVVIERL